MPTNSPELLRVLVHAQSLDQVLIQMLAFEFELHQPILQIARDSLSVELVTLALQAAAQLCTSSDSSHVVKFLTYGIIDVIKQKLLTHLQSSEPQSWDISINAAFALVNIAADPDLSA
jgi:hypothetical protein